MLRSPYGDLGAAQSPGLVPLAGSRLPPVKGKVATAWTVEAGTAGPGPIPALITETPAEPEAQSDGLVCLRVQVIRAEPVVLSVWLPRPWIGWPPRAIHYIAGWLRANRDSHFLR